MSSRARLITLVLIVSYAGVMICTNRLYTILDDESTIVTAAGNPVLPTLNLFLHGEGHNEHPPLSDFLLHAWLLATHSSFFALRIFANIFYIASIFVIALSARRLGGDYSYWATLALGFLWPFSFQYGRITGWYSVCMLLVSLVTWFYLRILERSSNWLWAGFVLIGILLVWSTYFGVAIGFLLAADLLLFHRAFAIKNILPLMLSLAAIVISSIPLIANAPVGLEQLTTLTGPDSGVKNLVAGAGYPIFAIFGSAAVAPWFLPLSIPIVLAVLALVVCLWFSSGRRWFAWFILALILLELSGHMNIKRVLFLLPWMFLAMSLAVTPRASRYPRMTLAAIALMIVAGWIGILSGKHYATTNLIEPWDRVAEVVASDTRNGATVISENFQFFFYMNYQLGLESETAGTWGPYLGDMLYRSHGYKLLEPDDWQNLAANLRGKVVVVNGSGTLEEVESTNLLIDRLRQHCNSLGEYKAAPDPAAVWKQQFTRDVPVLAYRTDVIWFDCSSESE